MPISWEAAERAVTKDDLPLLQQVAQEHPWVVHSLGTGRSAIYEAARWNSARCLEWLLLQEEEQQRQEPGQGPSKASTAHSSTSSSMADSSDSSTSSPRKPRSRRSQASALDGGRAHALQAALKGGHMQATMALLRAGREDLTARHQNLDALDMAIVR